MKTIQARFQRILLFCLALSLFLPLETAAQAAGMKQDARPAQAMMSGWDPGFGKVGVEGAVTVRVTALATAANGDLYVGGDFQKAGGVEAANIARWDGQRWHPLGKGLDGIPRAMVTDGNALYVVGYFNTAGSVNVNQLARWDGESWSKVGTGRGVETEYSAPGRLEALAIANGNLYIGGSFVSVDGVEAINIAQWDGSTWSALGKGLGYPDWEGTLSSYGSVNAIVVEGNNLYAGGDIGIADTVPVNGIARWDGIQWSALGNGLIDGAVYNEWATVSALAMSNGKLYAAGLFHQAGDVAANNIAMWHGDQWSVLGEGIADFSDDITWPVNVLLADGETLYAGGPFTDAGGEPIALLARWQNNRWSMIGNGLDNEYGLDSVSALALATDGSLYSGGYHEFVGGKQVEHLARWDGREWRALGGALMQSYAGDTPADVRVLVEDHAGRVFAGGRITTAGGIKVGNLAMLENGAWHNIGDANDVVYSMLVDGDDLYVGGAFTEIGGIAANHIARWHRPSGQWSALGLGTNGEVLTMVKADGILYVGGSFKNAGTVAADDVAWWDGNTWHPFGKTARIYEIAGPEVSTLVNALAVYGNLIFIGGEFKTIHFGEPFFDSFRTVHNLVAWDRMTDTWYLLGTEEAPGVQLTTVGTTDLHRGVNALAVVGDLLFVGGKFNRTGTLASSGLGCWDLRNSRWIPFSADLGSPNTPQVHALVQVENDLLVGGNFLTAGNAGVVNFVARFDTATESWSALDGGVKWQVDLDTEVYSLAASKKGVYVGGIFDTAGGLPSPGFARWHGALGGGKVPGGTPPPNPGLNIFLPMIQR